MKSQIYLIEALFALTLINLVLLPILLYTSNLEVRDEERIYNLLLTLSAKEDFRNKILEKNISALKEEISNYYPKKFELSIFNLSSNLTPIYEGKAISIFISGNSTFFAPRELRLYP